jgi:hypothetical protein
MFFLHVVVEIERLIYGGISDGDKGGDLVPVARVSIVMKGEADVVAMADGAAAGVGAGSTCGSGSLE